MFRFSKHMNTNQFNQKPAGNDAMGNNRYYLSYLKIKKEMSLIIGHLKGMTIFRIQKTNM